MVYAELAGHARRLSCGLAKAGVESGDHVALFAANRPEWIVACLAVIGAVAVPLDAQIDDEMLAHTLSDSGAGFVFTTAEGAKRIERLEIEAAPGLILLDTGDDDERSWRAFSRMESRSCRRLRPGRTTGRRCSTPPGRPARLKVFP